MHSNRKDLHTDQIEKIEPPESEPLPLTPQLDLATLQQSLIQLFKANPKLKGFSATRRANGSIDLKVNSND